MWHYACRPPGNEPPILEMKWAGKHTFPGFEVALSHECHFIPLTSLLEAVRCQIRWWVWIEVDTWMCYTMNEIFKQGCLFIRASYGAKSLSRFLTYLNYCVSPVESSLIQLLILNILDLMLKIAVWFIMCVMLRKCCWLWITKLISGPEDEQDNLHKKSQEHIMKEICILKYPIFNLSLGKSVVMAKFIFFIT